MVRRDKGGMRKRWTKIMSRRELLAMLGAGLAGLVLPRPLLAQHGGMPVHGSGFMSSYGRKDYFVWTQLRHSGQWNPNPRAAARLLSILGQRTSVEAAPREQIIKPGDPSLFERPFLYIAGRGKFADIGRDAESWLAQYVEHGGFVLIDDASGVRDSAFFQGAESMLKRVLPGRPLKPVPADHTVFQSFYLLNNVPGRKIASPFLYGIEMDDLTPVMVCQNDLGGAWDGDAAGYTYTCIPGGERQREMSFRMGVNLILYALTGNYKKDQVHIPFILKRRKR